MKTLVTDQEEFVYGPGAGRRGLSTPTLPRPKIPKLTLPKPTLPMPRFGTANGGGPPKRSQPGGRRGLPIVIILLVGLIAAAVLYLKPTASEPEPPASTAAAPSLADSTPVLFRYGFEQGDTRSYDMTMHMNLVPRGAGAEPFTGTITSTMTLNVVKRLADGASVLDVTIGNLKIDPPSPGGPAPNGGAKMRVTLAPDGRVLYFEGTGGVLGSAGSLSNGLFAGSSHASDETQSQFLFPQFADKGVKPGDTWKGTSSFALPFGDEKTIVTASGKHLGFQNSSYGRVAKFNYAVQSPLNFAFSIADLATIAAKQLAPGADPIDVPPGLENARFTMVGNMKMNADALVLQRTSDLIKLDGTIKTTMHLATEGIPESAAGSAPQAVDFDQTLRLSIVRIDGAGI